MKIERAKGTKDVPPEEEIVKQGIINELKKVFELYGFSPLETPILERMETLTAKYAGGSEILKEIFKLKDQGGRKLGLRYDLTVPLARFVSMNPTIKMPFKRYQIGLAFRDGPIKLGRYREFYQCDADIIGAKSILADIECLKMIFNFFKRVGLKITVEINNRKVLDGLMEILEIPNKERKSVIITIDKLKKMPLKDIKKELKEKGLYDKQINRMFEIFDLEGSNQEVAEQLRKIVTKESAIEGLEELKKVFKYIKTKDLVFKPSLARGLDYYTGNVFEVFVKDESLRSSIAAGGRYDDMIGKYSDNPNSIPAVGLTFGIDAIIDALKISKKIKPIKSVTKVFIIPIRTEEEAVKLADNLRKQGINTEIDLMERGISKNLDYANSLGIPFVVFIGKKELEQKKVKLKNMDSGNEKLLNPEQLVNELK